MMTFTKPELMAHRMVQAAEKLQDAKFVAVSAGRAEVAFALEGLIDELRRVHELAAGSEVLRREAA